MNLTSQSETCRASAAAEPQSDSRRTQTILDLCLCSQSHAKESDQHLWGNQRETAVYSTNLIDNGVCLLLVMLRCLQFQTRKKAFRVPDIAQESLRSPPGFLLRLRCDCFRQASSFWESFALRNPKE